MKGRNEVERNVRNASMRKTYHLCLSSHDEVIFRDQEDYIRGFNCFAEAVLETESRALADAEMSTHVHFGVQTDDFKEVCRSARYCYSRYFNNKYRRKGAVGNENFFWIELEGIKHIQTALSYIMRQGLHHGLSETPFGYKHSSCNSIFRRQLGKDYTPRLMPERSMYRFLSRNSAAKGNYRMSESGLLLREDVIDTAYVEELFITPRNFLFHMNRFSDERWRREQQAENPAEDPVTLENIEKGVPDNSIQDLLLNEKGRVDNSMFSDDEMCELIDKKYVPGYFKDSEYPSIYLLPDRSRAEIARDIEASIRFAMINRKSGAAVKCTTYSQLKRCLIL